MFKKLKISGSIFHNWPFLAKFGDVLIKKSGNFVFIQVIPSPQPAIAGLITTPSKFFQTQPPPPHGSYNHSPGKKTNSTDVNSTSNFFPNFDNFCKCSLVKTKQKLLRGPYFQKLRFIWQNGHNTQIQICAAATLIKLSQNMNKTRMRTD